MKRSHVNLALAGVVVALAAGVFLSEDPEEQGEPLTALSVDQIERVTLEHPEQPPIKLEKKDGQWQLTSPVIAAADIYEVNSVLGLATLEGKQPLKPEEVNLKELGLDPPAYKVMLNDVALEMGGVEPLNYRRYVRTATHILLVDDPPSAALDKEYADLVSKAVLPEKAQIVAIEVPGLKIAKAEPGWSATPADPVKGTPDNLQKFVDGWKAARSLWNEMAREELKGEPVKITLADGEVDLVLVARDPQLILAHPDLKVKYHLSKALGDELLGLPEPPPPPAADAAVAPTTAVVPAAAPAAEAPATDAP